MELKSKPKLAITVSLISALVVVHLVLEVVGIEHAIARAPAGTLPVADLNRAAIEDILICVPFVAASVSLWRGFVNAIRPWDTRIKTGLWAVIPLTLAALLLYIPMQAEPLGSPADPPVEYIFWPLGIARIFREEYFPEGDRMRAELVAWAAISTIIILSTLPKRSPDRIVDSVPKE